MTPFVLETSIREEKVVPILSNCYLNSLFLFRCVYGDLNSTSIYLFPMFNSIHPTDIFVTYLPFFLCSKLLFPYKSLRLKQILGVHMTFNKIALFLIPFIMATIICLNR